MQKICKKCIMFALFALFVVCSSSYDVDDIENKPLKIEYLASYVCEDTEVMETQSSIEPVTLFVFLTFIMIDSYFVKSYLWKAVLPVFWGCKYRVQSPRCKLTPNICSFLY